MSPEWDKKIVMEHQQQQLAPPSLAPPETTEEEVISLQPIGPGLQNLEPEGGSSSTGTLGRPARTPTPSFPIQDLVGGPPQPPPPHLTRSVEQFESTRSYSQPPPQMEPLQQPLPPQQQPIQTGMTETRFERQEVHGVQHQPQQMMPMPQPVAQQHVNRSYESHTLQSGSSNQQQQPQRSPSAQGYATLDRNKQITATLDRNRSHGGLSDTVSPFPDQDQSFESRTLERSRTLPAHASITTNSAGSGGTLKTSQTHHGETQTMDHQQPQQQQGFRENSNQIGGGAVVSQTMDRSYSTGSAQQFQQRSPQIQRAGGGSQTMESRSYGSSQQNQQFGPPPPVVGSQTMERSYSSSQQNQYQQQPQPPQMQGGFVDRTTYNSSTSSSAGGQFNSSSNQQQQFATVGSESGGSGMMIQGGGGVGGGGTQTIDRSFSSGTQQYNQPGMATGARGGGGVASGAQTMERSYSSASSSQQQPQQQYGGTQTIDRSFSGGSGGTQFVMDRSYSTGSGQQYSPQQVPETPPFPVSPTGPKTPYDNRGAVLLQGQSISQEQHSQGGGHMMARSQSAQSGGGMVQGQHVQQQYMQGSNATGVSNNTITRQQSVTPGGTQIVREYHETVRREITPGAPISQEERNRIQQGEFTFQQQQHQSQSQQHQAGGQMGTLTVDTNMASLGHQYSPGNQSSEAGLSPQMHSMTSQQSHTLRSQMSGGGGGGRITPGGQSMTGQSSPSGYMGHSRKGSFSSVDGSSELTQHTPRFVRDTSKSWYKPHISRDEAITLLRDKCAGTFVVRDSNSFPGAFGLAVKVAQVPPNVQTKGGGDPQTELVRHFLIEPTSKGVKLKGCSNEPVFASLAALVYQHSITPLALPCKLLLPDQSHEGVDMPDSAGPVSSVQLLAHGAACNVLYLYSADMESLTGPEAVAKATKAALVKDPTQKTTVVHFKVSGQGITLTDNKRKLFFRRHYPVASVTFCGMDPEDRKWTRNHEDTGLPMNAKVFGFVARKSGGSPDNQCHLFAELDTEQPATAIVNFVTKVMIGQGRIMKT